MSCTALHCRCLFDTPFVLLKAMLSRLNYASEALLVDKYPKATADVLSRFGGLEVVAVDVHGAALAPFISRAAAFVQLRAHTPLYHTSMTVLLTDQTVLIVEKNETVMLTVLNPSKPPKWTYSVQVPMHGERRTLDEMLARTAEAMGPAYFSYDSLENNCQIFVVSFLQANGLLSAGMRDKIVQAEVPLLKDNPIVRLLNAQKHLRTVTNIGRIASVAFGKMPGRSAGDELVGEIGSQWPSLPRHSAGRYHHRHSHYQRSVSIPYPTSSMEGMHLRERNNNYAGKHYRRARIDGS